ncbi:MAG TPA: sodium:proton antiporter [Polyangia bacterium]|jgi:Na+/H+ antiporter NhaD/arsenite permease-like protein|nr:sodium:proton antiporter [Polyangia bacterium]
MPSVPVAFATPLWAVLPFACYLLLIAGLPLFFGHFWESNRNKLLTGLVLGAPVIFYLLWRPDGAALLAQTLIEYVSFIALLGALFVISGGIYLRGSLTGTPLVNTVFMAVGSLLASLIGTTGASALLIRPLLRANQGRSKVTHMVVFFIFIVSNGAGMLTPLGDPPLFLGFLRGVPFLWTLRLAPPWAMANGVLLVLFYAFDWWTFRRDGKAEQPSAAPAEGIGKERLRIEGRINLLWLLGIVLTVFAAGTWGPAVLPDPHVRSLVQILCMMALAGASLWTTPRTIHEANRFSWAPIVEVGVVFIGIFVTMVPALLFLEERGATLGVTKPWQFFWASGALSSVLDNAPTYLTFASLATGVADHGAGVLSAANLGTLAAHPVGQQLLAAVACGSVFMGANTYIGNGPNFMVKAIAEQHHVRMPSFFGYTLWSGAILIPLFGLVALFFF